MKLIHDNLTIGANGILNFAGVDTVYMAKEYGTPLMILDEEGIRNQIRLFCRAMIQNFGEDSEPLYASKALCIKTLYSILQEEGIGADLISGGEMLTAVAGGFDMNKAYMHGNYKNDEELAFAMKNKLGVIVIDNSEDARNINLIAGHFKKRQKVLLRLIPGVDPDTHKAILTGHIDSKFGVSIKTGEALELVREILKAEHLDLLGFHSHIGSQILDVKPFCDTAVTMLNFIYDVREKTGFETLELNLGGGFGVQYTLKEQAIDYESWIREIGITIQAECKRLNLRQPRIKLEPGRSIVAANGITLYTIGAIKKNPGKTFIIVDGGMTDNPRYALYRSAYSVYIANKMNLPSDFTATIGGRCCESGDILQEEVKVPFPEKGDILAFAVTGAYNYSMAMNYNRVPRPAIIMLDKNGNHRPVVKRENWEDLLRLDV